MEALAERGLPSVALDLRGHGESPLGEPEDFSPGQLALDVREALVREGVVPEEGGAGGPGIVLLGHSMGGRVAARYAADHPRDLAALVLADIDCQLLKEGQVHRPGMAKRKALFVSGEVSPRAEERFRHGFASWEANNANDSDDDNNDDKPTNNDTTINNKYYIMIMIIIRGAEGGARLERVRRAPRELLAQRAPRAPLRAPGGRRVVELY